MFGVEDTRPKKSKLSKGYKEYKARRAEALAPVKEKIDQIQSLIDEGKNREAYRIFEELPLADQLAVSLAPGVGDALAVFETQEFGTRGGERFEEGDVLGGLGNYLLSGLSGISTIPFFGAVGDVAKIGVKGIGRAARTADDMGGGPSSVKIDDPRANEYAGTRPEIRPVDTENMQFKAITEEPPSSGFGLISGTREFLQNLPNPDKPKNIESLISQIKKHNPRYEGELRGLKVLDDSGKISQEFKDYFKALPEYSEGKIPPNAFDAYLARNQKDLFNIQEVPREHFASPGYGDIIDELETQRVYRIDGVDTGKSGNIGPLHYIDSGGYGSTYNERLRYPDYYSMDSTDVRNTSLGNELRVNRVQSDYVEEIGKITEKRKIEGERQSPYLSDGKEEFLARVPVDVIEKELGPLLDKTNKLAKEINELKFSRFDDMFNADGSLKLATDIDPKNMSTRLTKEEGTRLNLLELDHQSASDALEKAIKKLAQDKALPDTEIREIAAGKLTEFVMPTGLENIFKFLKARTDIIEGSPELKGTYSGIKYNPDLGNALNPDLLDTTKIDSLGLPYDNFKFKFNPELFTGTKTDPLSLTVKGEKTLDDIIDKLNQSTIKSNEAINLRNQELHLKDPYATDVSSKSEILPTRNLINLAAQNPDIDYLTMYPQKILKSEDVSQKYRTNKKNQGHYNDIVTETRRVLKELGVDRNALDVKKIDKNYTKDFAVDQKMVPLKSLDVDHFLDPFNQGYDLDFKVPVDDKLKVTESYVLDLEPIRKAIIEDGKRIKAFKYGGLANIDRLLNNL